jgi:hypothetical protein
VELSTVNTIHFESPYQLYMYVRSKLNASYQQIYQMCPLLTQPHESIE